MQYTSSRESCLITQLKRKFYRQLQKCKMNCIVSKTLSFQNQHITIIYTTKVVKNSHVHEFLTSCNPFDRKILFDIDNFLLFERRSERVTCT